MNLTFKDLRKEVVEVREKKTGKIRSFKVNKVVKQAVDFYPETATKTLGGKCFVGRTGAVYTSQNVNRRLKKVFEGNGKLVTSHSLRKT